MTRTLDIPEDLDEGDASGEQRGAGSNTGPGRFAMARHISHSLASPSASLQRKPQSGPRLRFDPLWAIVRRPLPLPRRCLQSNPRRPR